MKDYIKRLNLNKNTLVFENEPLKKHTTFGVGGVAELFIYPKTIDDIIKIISYAKVNNEKIQFIGSGSNILASDKGYKGIIITLKKALNEIVFLEKEIYVQAGAGVVADSIPKNEFRETENKAKALLKALE